MYCHKKMKLFALVGLHDKQQTGDGMERKILERQRIQNHGE
jgi:hypothetical protein